MTDTSATPPRRRGAGSRVSALDEFATPEEAWAAARAMTDEDLASSVLTLVRIIEEGPDPTPRVVAVLREAAHRLDPDAASIPRRDARRP